MKTVAQRRASNFPIFSDYLIYLKGRLKAGRGRGKKRERERKIEI